MDSTARWGLKRLRTLCKCKKFIVGMASTARCGVGMASTARWGLKLEFPLQWHLLEQRRRQAHPEAPTKQTAASDELVAPQPPAPTPPWSVPGWVPDADGSPGCGYADGRARRLWGRATHDAPRNSPPFPQSATRTALPARQTTRGYLAQTGASHAW